MRIRTINFWMNQLSAERKNTKEPQSSKDLNYPSLEMSDPSISQWFGGEWGKLAIFLQT